MSGRTALVTGGSQGLGAACVSVLRAAGYEVAAISRHAAGRMRTLTARDTRLHAIDADVTDATDTRRAVDEAADRFGRLDVVVCAAGVSLAAPTAVRDVDDEDWRRVMATNVDGVLNTVRAALPHLDASENAHVVTVLSTGAWRVEAGVGPYAASKFAARALTEALTAECRGSGIRVSSISPGPIDTTIWDHKLDPPSRNARRAMLSARDVADIVRWLVEQPPGVHVGDVTITPWTKGR